MTFITNLTQSGFTPKTAQIQARHSDINLTLYTYAMVGVLDKASAVEMLPPIPQGASDDEGKSNPRANRRRSA
jgi:hypothetical protein